LDALLLRHEPVLGRRLAEHADAEPLDQLEALGWIEPALVEDDRGAGRPRAEQHVPDRLRPTRARGAPDEVARPRREPALCLPALGPGVAVGVGDAFRVLRRAARVEDEGAVARGGVGRLGAVGLLLEAGLVEREDLDLGLHAVELAARLGDGPHKLRAGAPAAGAAVPRAAPSGPGGRPRARRTAA